MPSCRQFTPVDLVELKSQLFKKLGRQKAEKYFYYFKRLMSLKLSKLEFDKLCYNTIGKENIALHNLFIRSILANACLGVGPPSKQTATGHSRTSKISSGQLGDAFPASPRRGRSITSRQRKIGDRPSPLGPNGKAPPGQMQEVTNSCDMQRSRDQQSAPELISIGSKAPLEVASVEDGEEVEQVRGSPCVQSRSPIRAPLGIPKFVGPVSRKAILSDSAAGFHILRSYVPQSCCSTSELPDSRSLCKQLERKLEAEGLGVSLESANLLNFGLDAFLRRLIKPCMALGKARCTNRRMSRANGTIMGGMNGGLNQRYYASLQDFQVAMESNPQLLGGNWPVQLEKMSLRSLQE